MGYDDSSSSLMIPCRRSCNHSITLSASLPHSLAHLPIQQEPHTVEHQSDAQQGGSNDIHGRVTHACSIRVRDRVGWDGVRVGYGG